ncbi:hypothetical protein HN682_08100 [Candidatus Peregrinibacteria bacterium]|nr:hypothetical protein [Candidatus Peregrinibacteria bacterium]
MAQVGLINGVIYNKDGEVGGGGATIVVDNVTDLVTEVNGASAGDVIQMMGGTYILTSGTGNLTPANGVSLIGSGGGTIITDDGTLADHLIDVTASLGSTYTIDNGAGANPPSEAKSVFTITHADAGNVNKGDLIKIVSTSGDGMMNKAAADGNASTGEVALVYRLPHAYVHTSSTIAVVDTANVGNVFRDFTLLAESSSTKAGINTEYTDTVCIDNIKAVGPNGNTAWPGIAVSFAVSPYVNAITEEWDSRSKLYYASNANFNMRSVGGKGKNIGGLGNDMANICFSHLNVTGTGGSSTFMIDIYNSYRNLMNIISTDTTSSNYYLSMGASSDENRINGTSWDSLNNNGAGNSVSQT